MNKRNEPDYEEWMREFVDKGLRPALAELGYKLPNKIDCDFSFTSSGKRKGRDSEWWDPRASSHEVPRMIVLTDTADVTTITNRAAHAAVHGAVGAQAGHGKPFRDCALRLGMEGKMRECIPGPRLRKRLDEVIEAMPPFPRGALNFEKYSPSGEERRVVDRADPQKSRQLKCECLEDNCEYIARVSAKNLRRGAPICPEHLKPMWHEELPAESGQKQDEAEKRPVKLQEPLALTYSPAQELGHEPDVSPPGDEA